MAFSFAFFADAPLCKANQTNITIGVAFGEIIKLQCDVDAEPNQVTFYWTSNNSTKNHLKFINKGLTSILTFEKITKDDIGNISCSARNIVGNQKEPCIFQIIAAGWYSIHKIYFLNTKYTFSKQKDQRKVLLFTKNECNIFYVIFFV